MKAGTPEMMKFKKLQKRLGESTRGIVGLLDLLWQRTTKECPAGDIGRFSNEEIAILCDWEGDPDELVTHLVETRWLDTSTEHRLVVHDWHEHAPTYLKGAFASSNKSFASSLSDEHSEPPSDGLSGALSPSLSGGLSDELSPGLGPPLPNRTEPIRTDPIRSVDGSTMDAAVPSDPSAAVPRIRRVLQKMPGKPSDRDRQMVVRAALLSLTAPYSEHWLHDGVEGVLQASSPVPKPYAYLRSCWKNSAQKLQRDLSADLRAVKVPPGFGKREPAGVPP